MVLFAIVGELGSGKTLSLVYLAWNNWFRKERQVFSNIDLFGFPFVKVESIPELDRMKEGFFLGDELWLWVDSWAGASKKQKVINAILLKSRKRGITIVYTAQSIHQVGKRIRDVTDFIAYPLMSVDNSYCRLEIFRGPRPTTGSRINPPIYFNCEPVYAMFNTYEEVRNITDIDDEQKKNDFSERFLPIERNPAWIRYLKKDKGYPDERIIKESRELQSSINPDGITSEMERKDKKADFVPI